MAHASRLLSAALVILTAAALPACGWLAHAQERQIGREVAAQYQGLQDKSLAIVVYADPAILFEYPDARKEVSAFLAKKFHAAMPSVRMLDYNQVINWQNETMNWQALPEKDIGKHFGVDRVLYVELTDYGTRDPGAQDLLRGRIRAVARVFEADMPGNAAAWRGEYAVFWPETGPATYGGSDDRTARIRVLDRFSERVVNAFHDHRERDPSIREKAG